MYLRHLELREQISKELKTLESLKDFAISCIVVGDAHTCVKKPSGAIGIYRRSAALCEVIVEKESTPENHAQLASVYEKAVNLCYKMQLYGESKTYSQRHLQVLNVLTTEVEHPMLHNRAAFLRLKLYVLCMNLGQKKEAEAYIKDALENAEENCLRYPDEETLKETLEYIKRVLAGDNEAEDTADK